MSAARERRAALANVAAREPWFANPQRFRKKPVVIEAIQYLVANRDAVIAWCGAQGTAIDEEGCRYELENIVIHTLEGDHRANLGDWIIKGVKGEFYPCKPDIFEATYEAENSQPGSGA